MSNDIKNRNIELTIEENLFLSTINTKGLTKFQKKTLCVLYKKLGNISQMCKGMVMTRDVYYRWINNYKDDTYKKAVYEIQEGIKDDLESTLYKKAIIDKDTAALIWLSKVKLKNRGYGEQNNFKTKVNSKTVNKYANWTNEKLDKKIIRLKKMLR